MRRLFLVCLLGLVTGCTLPIRPLWLAPYPVGISFAPEMTYIPEDDWPSVEADQYSLETQKMAQKWQAIAPWVESQVSPATVRALSRWALSQMEQYRSLPSFANLEFQAVALQPDGDLVLFQSTVDTLPSHSPLVTRWLEIFLVYSKSTESILRVTITIRGQVLE